MFDTLRMSTLLSSVPLSPEARKRADETLGKNNYTIDSVEFSADTFDNIENAKKIYPILPALYAKYPNAGDQKRITELLQASFAHRTHGRHMLYTEGNANMFRELHHAVTSGKLTKEQFQFWYCHWLINITGFRGRSPANGSLYLTHNTYVALRALKETLDQLFTETPPSPEEMLNSYLDKRAAMLKLNPELSANEKRLLAHFGSMMRMFHPDEGGVLELGLRCIPKSVVTELANTYFDANDSLEPTPTYAPALFQNVIDFRKQEYSKDSILQQIKGADATEHVKMTAERLKSLLAVTDTVVGCLPLYLKTLETYKALRKEGKIPPKQPLSFAEAAKKPLITEAFGISPVFQPFNILEHYSPTINAQGVVSFEKLAPKPVVPLTDNAQAARPSRMHFNWPLKMQLMQQQRRQLLLQMIRKGCPLPEHRLPINCNLSALACLAFMMSC